MKVTLVSSLLILFAVSAHASAPKTLKCRVDTSDFSKQLTQDKEVKTLLTTVIETSSEDGQYTVRIDAWQPNSDSSSIKRNILVGVTDKKSGAQFFSGSYIPGRVLSDVDYASAQVVRDQAGSASIVVECSLQ